VEYHLTACGKKFLRLLRVVERLQAELNEGVAGEEKAVKADES
jgi:hypothetical protein